MNISDFTWFKYFQFNLVQTKMNFSLPISNLFYVLYPLLNKLHHHPVYLRKVKELFKIPLFTDHHIQSIAIEDKQLPLSLSSSTHLPSGISAFILVPTIYTPQTWESYLHVCATLMGSEQAYLLTSLPTSLPFTHYCPGTFRFFALTNNNFHCQLSCGWRVLASTTSVFRYHLHGETLSE